MTKNNWQAELTAKLRKALKNEDPEYYSTIKPGEKLIGHSVFAQVSDSSLEDVSALLAPSDRITLRLLLTHRVPNKTDGDHVVVIGMNPSVARAFSGKVKIPEQCKDICMPETDDTACVVRGWLESDALRNTQRLTMINLIPSIETKSENVPKLLKEWNGPDLEQIFRQTLEAVLLNEDVSVDNLRIICAWGTTKKKPWVAEGQRWFCEFIREHDEKIESAGGNGQLEPRVFRLKYGQRKEETGYPPHPNMTPSLKNGNNELIQFRLDDLS